MEENRQELQMKDGDEISVGEFFRSIFKRGGGLIFLVATILVAVLCFSVIQFGIMPSSAERYYEYELDFPSIEKGRYPDGSRFYYLDAISLDNLKLIKDTDFDGDGVKEFANIDVEKMSERQEITLERETLQTDTLSTGESKTVYQYKLAVATKYFANENLVNSFLRAVAESPKRYIEASANIDTSTYDSLFSEAKSYYKQLSAITAQKNMLVAEYTALEKEMGKTYRVNGKTFTQYVDEVTLAYAPIQTLLGELENKQYLLGTAEELTAYQASLDSELSVLNDKIAEYEKIAANPNEDLYDTYVKLVERKSEIVAEQKTLQTTTEVGATEFGQKVAQAKDSFAAQSNVCVAVKNQAFSAETLVGYTTQKAQSDGVLGTAIVAIASVLMGVVLGFIVAWVARIVRDKVEKKQASKTQA